MVRTWNVENRIPCHDRVERAARIGRSHIPVDEYRLRNRGPGECEHSAGSIEAGDGKTYSGEIFQNRSAAATSHVQHGCTSLKRRRKLIKKPALAKSSSRPFFPPCLSNVVVGLRHVLGP